MKNEKNEQATVKKTWQEPELTVYGSVEKITLKGYGTYDGSGLAPKGTHPSL
jgi:hypothetical protein